MIEITDSNLKSEILEADKLAVLDFSATWCQPCKKLTPILEELSVQYDGKVVIGHCDVQKAPETAKLFGIMAVPTVILFKDGQEVDRFVGLQSKDQIAKKLDDNA